MVAIRAETDMDEASKEDSEAKWKIMNCLNQLKEYPHLLDEILSHLNRPINLEAGLLQKLLPSCIHNSYLWKMRWLKNKADSPLWRTLAARMEHANPKLGRQINQGNASSYQEAYNFVQQNIQQTIQFNVEKYYKYFTLRSTGQFILNERNFFISNCGYITIIDRWSGKVVNQLNESTWISEIWEMQLNDQFLACKYYSGEITVHSLANYELVQKINDDDPTDFTLCSHGFYLGNDLLINVVTNQNTGMLVVKFRRWNPSTRQFGPNVEEVLAIKMQYLELETKLYYDHKFLILDTYDSMKFYRIIRVFDGETFELVRQRSFYKLPELFVEREYYDRVIIVEKEIDNKVTAVAWNIEENTFHLIFRSSFPKMTNKYIYSRAVAHHQHYQFAVRKCTSRRNFSYLDVFPVKDRYSCENSLNLKNVSIPVRGVPKQIYFDGVQFIYKIGTQWNLVDYI